MSQSTTQRGPTSVCRQNMTDSTPCLICVSSLAFLERKTNFGFFLSTLFRVGLHNRIFGLGSQKTIGSHGQIIKITLFVHSKRVFSKNLHYFQENLILSSVFIIILTDLHYLKLMMWCIFSSGVSI